tara:strand:+ start:13801 stop:14019 length:219 start_codon:yes stop_codon:yes gene_type:complete
MLGWILLRWRRMMKLTKEQQVTIYNKWETNNIKESYLTYRRKVKSMLGIPEVSIVYWNGMWCCIESDGYSHT